MVCPITAADACATELLFRCNRHKSMFQNAIAVSFSCICNNAFSSAAHNCLLLPIVI